MVGMHSMALVYFQQSGGHQDTHNGVIWLAVIGIAMILQSLAVVGAGFAAWKLMKKIDSITDAFEQKTGPIIQKSNALLDELGPKARAIITNAEETSYTVRVKVDELANTVDHLNRTVREINERSRVQISRVDGIVTDALTTTYEVSRTVQDSIKGPVRQIAGIVAGVKTGIETLIARSPFGVKSGPGKYDL